MAPVHEEAGVYRTIHSVLVVSQDFRDISDDAKLIFFELRFSPENNLASIFLFYPEVLQRRVNMPWIRISKAWRELEAKKWIVYQDPILWIRNGLRFSPNVSLKNEKHLKAIQTVLLGLPKQSVLMDFITYYSLSGSLFDSLSHRLSDTQSIPYPIQDKDPSRNREGTEKEVFCDERTPPASSSPAIDPYILEVLSECPNLKMLTNGDSADWWSALIAAIEPYGLGKAWVNTKLRGWNTWLENNPARRSREPKRLRTRLWTWLEKDLDKEAKKPR